MTDAVAAKSPVWFRVAAILALLWNLIGVASYIMHVTMSPEAVAQMSEAQRQIHDATPAWVIGAFAVAVFSGALGSLGLVLRKAWAKWLLVLSLVAVLAQQSWLFVLSNAAMSLGGSAVALPAAVTLVAIALVVLAHRAEAHGWLS